MGGAMTAAGRSGMRRVLLVLLTLALLGSCTRDPPAEPSSAESASAVVAAGQPTTVETGGVKVTVPPGAASNGTTVSLRLQNADAPVLPPSMEPIGQAAAISLEGRSLLGEPATVTFPLPADVDGERMVPVVLWQDHEGGWRWLPSSYNMGDTSISATTDHFSIGFVARVDVSRWANDRRQDFLAYLSSRSNAAQPKCGDETRPAGLGVTSDRGDSVKWCFGTENGQNIMKIANNRRTFTQITYPNTWRVAGAPSLELNPESLNRALSTKLAGATAPVGTSVRIIDGGDTLNLIVPPGSQGHVLAQMSIDAWLLSGLKFGVETYSAVAAVAGEAGIAASHSWARIVDRLADVGAASNGYRDAFKECGRAAGGLTESDLSKVAIVSLKSMWDCIPALMKADIQESGVAFYAIGIVLTAIGKVTGFVLTAANLLISGAREIYDEIASFGGQSDALYDIILQSDITVQTGSANEFAVTKTIGLPGSPYGIDIDTTRHLVYVVTGQVVSIVDSGTNSVTGKIVVTPTGDSTLDVAVDPIANAVYVPRYPDTVDAGTLSSYNGNSRSQTGSVSVGAVPYTVAVDPIFHTVYTANHGAASVSVVDAATNSVVDEIPVGAGPMDVAVDTSSHTIYCTNQSGTLTVIDGWTNVVSATIQVGHNSSSIAVNSVTHQVYVVNTDDNTVSVIDGTTKKVTANLKVGEDPSGVALNPNTDIVYITNIGDNTVTIIDGDSAATVSTVPVGTWPRAVAVDPGSNIAYVANGDDNTISVIEAR